MRSWSGSPTSFSYQWEDCNALGEALSISGAVAETYLLGPATSAQRCGCSSAHRTPTGSTAASSAQTGTIAASPPGAREHVAADCWRLSRRRGNAFGR